MTSWYGVRRRCVAFVESARGTVCRYVPPRCYPGTGAYCVADQFVDALTVRSYEYRLTTALYRCCGRS
ncbi:hypothetical protein C8T65DRAFT_197662 [Cerioporus squamosus]|nr:hypothetical protein C8T65DRAFT_197662 [Cerioporus squamosus]